MKQCNFLGFLMVYNGIAKVQHYVPQFLLRNFGKGKKDQFYVFDKQKAKTFSTNVKNVACESRFYDFELDGESLTLEPLLSEIEGKTKPLFQRILEADNLSVLSIEDRVHLSAFFSIQFARTKNFREQQQYLYEKLTEKIKSVDKDFYTPDRKDIAEMNMMDILEAPNVYGWDFANKIWILLQTENKRPFIIGDNPVTMRNRNKNEPYPNVGLAVPGIEIYFPLSPTRALAMLCFSFEDIWRKEMEAYQYLSERAPKLVADHIAHVSRIKQTLAAIGTGRPLLYRPEQVADFNTLQVIYAERFIFSCMEDFKFAREMMSSHPEIQKGPRKRVR
jgi:Protein of unknown function (DUF4238)